MSKTITLQAIDDDGETRFLSILSWCKITGERPSTVHSRYRGREEGRNNMTNREILGLGKSKSKSTMNSFLTKRLYCGEPQLITAGGWYR